MRSEQLRRGFKSSRSPVFVYITRCGRACVGQVERADCDCPVTGRLQAGHSRLPYLVCICAPCAHRKQMTSDVRQQSTDRFAEHARPMHGASSVTSRLLAEPLDHGLEMREEGREERRYLGTLARAPATWVNVDHVITHGQGDQGAVSDGGMLQLKGGVGLGRQGHAPRPFTSS